MMIHDDDDNFDDDDDDTWFIKVDSTREELIMLYIQRSGSWCDCNLVTYNSSTQSLSIVLSMILLLLPLLQLTLLLSSHVDCVVGNAWIEAVDVNEHKIGQLSKAMWLALRREMQSVLAYQQQHRNKT